MDDNDRAYTALGEAIAEAIVLSAGLIQAKDPSLKSVSVTLDFNVYSDVDGKCLVISHERIGAPPLEVRVAVPGISKAGR